MCDKDNIDYEQLEKINSEINNDNKGFLYKETIYKVKSDENE